MATMKITQEIAADALRGMDWAAVDATTDEEIARQVAGNPGAAPLLSDAELDRATFGERAKAFGSG